MTGKRAVISILVLALLLAVFAAGCGGDEKAGTSTAPPADTGGRVQLAETTFDFGNVPTGQKVEHKFTVKNSGTGPLELGQIAVKRLEGC